MKTELVVCSYAPDFWWYQQLLRSINKYVTGFSGVMVIVPWSDLSLFLPTEGTVTADGAKLYVKTYHPHPTSMHISHQVQKCYADVYCPQADYIAFVDSDSIFSSPARPESFFYDGKPCLYHRPFSSYTASAPELNWKRNVDFALKVDAQSECMQHLPAVYHQSLFQSVRDRVEKTNFCPFYQFALAQKGDFPWGFCEFPTLGAWAMMNHSNEYHAINMEEFNPLEMIVKQYWSHCRNKPEYADMFKKASEEIERYLG